MMVEILVFLNRDRIKVEKTVTFPTADNTKRMEKATTEGRIREM
jgi:hypothetical protein